jgi:hypothetical protein
MDAAVTLIPMTDDPRREDELEDANLVGAAIAKA